MSAQPYALQEFKYDPNLIGQNATLPDLSETIGMMPELWSQILRDNPGIQQ